MYSYGSSHRWSKRAGKRGSRPIAAWLMTTQTNTKIAGIFNVMFDYCKGVKEFSRSDYRLLDMPFDGPECTIQNGGLQVQHYQCRK